MLFSDLMHIIKLVFSLVFSLAGTFMLFISLKEGMKPYRLMKYGVETDGVVVEIYKRPMRVNEKTNGSFAPVVKFLNSKGEMSTYYSTTFTNPCDFVVGQKVKLWYDANDPTLATMEGKDNWILATAFGVFGIGICLVFYPMLIRTLWNWGK